jgi:DNA-binding Xre family transcriptional regulator
MMPEYCETCGQPLGEAPATIDWQEFALKIRVRMAQENLSLRQLQQIIGVDQAIIHRVAKNAKPVRVEAYLALEAWCGEHRPKDTSHDG